MTLLHRLDLALHSSFGIALTALTAVLILMLASYAILTWIKRKNRLFTRYCEREFSKIITQSYLLKSHQRNELLGRHSLVAHRLTGEEALCLIPLPEWRNDEVCERFQVCAQELRAHPLDHLAQHLWFYAKDEKWLLVQRERRMNLAEHCLDRKLKALEAERLLLDIAAALSALHHLHNPLKRPFYYGWLSPVTIELMLDAQSEIHTFTLPDAGVVYAVGPELLYNRFKELREGRASLTPFVTKEWLAHFEFLAPEQLDKSRLVEVGPAADYYSFARLALKLFTLHTDEGEAPKNWRTFLQSCLDPLPEKRPRDFSEIRFASTSVLSSRGSAS